MPTSPEAIRRSQEEAKRSRRLATRLRQICKICKTTPEKALDELPRLLLTKK